MQLDLPLKSSFFLVPLLILDQDFVLVKKYFLFAFFVTLSNDIGNG